MVGEWAGSCTLGQFEGVSPPHPVLRIASKHAGGSDVDGAIGKFDLCFQGLTGKILTTQHLAELAEADSTASALAMICFFGGGAQGQMSQWACGSRNNNVTNMVMFATIDACER
jgi:hypothetical protein